MNPPREDRLTRTETRVLLAAIATVGPNYLVRIHQVADLAGVSVATVATALRRLAAMGFVEVYTINTARRDKRPMRRYAVRCRLTIYRKPEG